MKSLGGLEYNGQALGGNGAIVYVMQDRGILCGAGSSSQDSHRGLSPTPPYVIVNIYSLICETESVAAEHTGKAFNLSGPRNEREQRCEAIFVSYLIDQSASAWADMAENQDKAFPRIIRYIVPIYLVLYRDGLGAVPYTES